MSHPTGQRHQRHFPLNDAPQPKFAQHPPEPAIHMADTPTTPSASPVNVIITGPKSRVNITSAIAKDGSTSKIGIGEEAADLHAPWSKKKIWGTVATTIMVLGAIAGVIALFL